MYNKEVVVAIYERHMYEYCIVNHCLQVVKYSEEIFKYCERVQTLDKKGSLFEMVPELFGMENELRDIFQGSAKELLLPLVFKEPDQYVNIRVSLSSQKDTLIVLFENITEITKTQQALQQVNNENLLLIKEIKEKNRQLQTFNDEMQRLVDEEVAKNLEKQHMMELQTRHAQMGEMIAMITHQWKQPLSVIQTLGSSLKMKHALGSLNAELFTEKMDNLLNQSMHMSQTVSDFQKFFTPSNKKVDFDIKETIASVLKLIEIDYTLHNIEIEVVEEDAVSVFGYENQYTQVILAILQNAKDALLSTVRDNKKITISLLREKDRSLVRIHDNAGGIPQEIIDTIFTQYVTTKENGSGLGLYIAKSVIENNMQGELWVKNTSEGALFSVLI
jgi:signal transduction histidine kinase